VQLSSEDPSSCCSCVSPFKRLGAHILKPQATTLAAMANPDGSDYFRANAPPPALKSHKKLASAFITDHFQSNRSVVLVTSGGTTVPLENQTVRFIDNFSAGTRGATSAEYFLEAGYAVIFLHRQYSLLPYSRHYSHSTNCFLDFMAEGHNGEVVVNPEYQEKMLGVLRKYNAARKGNRLLLLSFTTITEYLWELKEIAMLMRPLGPKALFYLTAAVSDFFLPKDRLSEHKIQSSDNGDTVRNGHAKTESGERASGQGKKLVVDLDPVPKLLKCLVDGWAPEGMIVSFKLETDSSLLVSKAHQALGRYSHHLVIGNLLSTRKYEVVFIAPNSEEKWIRVPVHRRAKSFSNPLDATLNTKPKFSSNGQVQAQEQNLPDEATTLEIESLIVPEVTEMHKKFVETSHNTREEDEKDMLERALAWAEFGAD